MTSHEIVRRAVEFDRPSRIPVRFASMGIDDTFGVPLQAAAGWAPSQDNEDEWGCVWHKPAGEIVNMGQPNCETHRGGSRDRPVCPSLRDQRPPRS